MDRALLAGFLRARRASLRPEDVGLPPGTRRRTAGLRREEVAVLSGISTDYYCRIEQQRGAEPSEQILSAIARGLALNTDERDHLFRLGGFAAPRRTDRPDGVSAAMMRIIERMSDTPVLLMNRLGTALVQNQLAVDLLGDFTRFTGLERHFHYRWFIGESGARDLYPVEDHAQRGRVFVAEIRADYTADPTGPAGEIVESLLDISTEFARMWSLHEVGVVHHHELKRYLHPELGELELYCQLLVEPDEHDQLHIFTAEPGSSSEGKLRRLATLRAG